jgi:predicted transcriptional regulator
MEGEKIMTFESYLNILKILNKDLYDAYTKCVTADPCCKKNKDLLEKYHKRQQELAEEMEKLKSKRAELYHCKNELLDKAEYEGTLEYPDLEDVKVIVEFCKKDKGAEVWEEDNFVIKKETYQFTYPLGGHHDESASELLEAKFEDFRDSFKTADEANKKLRELDEKINEIDEAFGDVKTKYDILELDNICLKKAMRQQLLKDRRKCADIMSELRSFFDNVYQNSKGYCLTLDELIRMYYEDSDKIYFEAIYEARISKLLKAHPDIKLDNGEIYVNILNYKRAFEIQKAHPNINIIHDDNFEEFCLVGTTYYGCVGTDFVRACREMFRDA